MKYKFEKKKKQNEKKKGEKFMKGEKKAGGGGGVPRGGLAKDHKKYVFCFRTSSLSVGLFK